MRFHPQGMNNPTIVRGLLTPDSLFTHVYLNLIHGYLNKGLDSQSNDSHSNLVIKHPLITFTSASLIKQQKLSLTISQTISFLSVFFSSVVFKLMYYD